MDALAKEADENPMFREDGVSQFFTFREWFTSASQAASFVLFASTNGLTSWMDAAGTTLKALQG